MNCRSIRRRRTQYLATTANALAGRTSVAGYLFRVVAMPTIRRAEHLPADNDFRRGFE